LPKEKLTKVLKEHKRVLLVENNSTAQLGQILMMTTGIEIKDRLLKYSGRPIYPEEILERVERLL
jgi:2-oxoglutarate ferredoxin oxidoreductase subunit alpha